MSASRVSGRPAPSRPSPSANAPVGNPPRPAFLSPVRRPASATAARRPACRRFSGLVFACLALCAAALPAQAQDVTLVTNWDESAFIEGNTIMAQAFTTGSQTGGYTLKSVELEMRQASTPITLTGYLTIRENDNNAPGDVVATLTPPSSLSDSLSAATFTAPANTELTASTTYWVVAGDNWRFGQSTNRPHINRVAGNGESGETSWSIANTRFWKNSLDGNWSFSTSSILKIRILGPGANTAPVFADSSLDRSVAENTAAGINVGDAIPEATDADSGDTLTYSMEGTDAASFDFDADNRQIKTKTGVTYDFETKSSYAVTVKVEDGNGGSDTVDVTINLTDVDEPPAAPAAPTVTATSGSNTKLDLSWTAPDNAGRPPITGYDLRYSTDGSSWTESSLAGFTLTSVNISGLTPGTEYQVQVRAVNDEGRGGWSPSGTGRTAPNNAPVFADATLDRSVNENSPAGINVGDPIPAATDADSGDTLTYSMEGTDSASFDFGAEARQIKTRAGVTYDFEAKSSYSVTVKVEDAAGGSDTVDVTINLTDADEPPAPPAAPTVTATSGSTTSLDVSWTAPDNAGKPAITSYDLRYRAGTSGSWTDGPQDQTGTSASITGLAAGTEYQVQVQAVNHEGRGDWSPSGTGSTTASANNAPAFPNDTETRLIAENTAANTAVGAAIPEATDADSDTLTYSMEGTDAASFDFDADNRQIKTKSGVTYDYEAKVIYGVTIKADDGKGGTDTVAVTISLTDVDEPPAAPAAPTVTATSGSTTSLDVSWTAPANVGKPTITSYDLRYRAGTSGSWTDGPQDQTGTSASITGLTAGTAYQVQVRATNDEGDGGWSASGTGTTGTTPPPPPANNAPVFADATLARSVAENTAANTAVGAAIPAATDADNGDTLTYSMEGTDAASFDFDASTRLIRTKSGVTYDFEAKSSYSVTIKVEDGNGGSDTVDVTINLTDADEPPAAPAAPTVTATSGSATSLDVSWTAPANAGKPAITGYDLRYRAGTSGSWTDGPQDVTGTSAAVTGLTADTAYQVQVRATNDEGEGDWSASGSGSTGTATATNTAPTVTITAVSSTADHVTKNNVPGSYADFIISVNRSPEERLDVWLGWEEAERGLAKLSDNWATRDRYVDIHFMPGGQTSVQVTHILMDRYSADDKPMQTLTYFIAEDRDDSDPHNTAQSDPDYSVGTPSKACVTVNVDTPDSSKPDCAAMLGPRPQAKTSAPRVPGAPGGLTATASGGSRIDLAWTAPAGEVTGYEVEWSADGETGWQPVDPPDDGKDTSHSHTGLEAETTYFYRVRGVNEHGEGPWALARATTAAAAAGLTAAFEDAPDEHEGPDTTFTVRLTFSEAVSAGYRTLRDEAVEATNGALRKAKRVNGSSAAWDITVAPSSDAAVTLSVDGGTDECGTGDAVCTADGRRLANAPSVTVAGPTTGPRAEPRTEPPAALTAEFDGVPDEHDGESTFTFGLTFSEEPRVGFRALRDEAFEVSGGAVRKARRQQSGSDQNWTITVEPDGAGDVLIALPETTDCDADGAICTADGRPLSNALSGTVRGPALLNVADARAGEGAGATLAFAVTLSRAAGAAVAVDYATRDGSATAGEDYTAASGTLEFAAGETSKTVSVTVLDDAVDEGEETFVLALSNATGARLDDAEATGTIANADPLPKAWLGRFARAAADHAVDAIDERLREDPVAEGMRASFGPRSGSWGGIPGGPVGEDGDGFAAEPGSLSLGGHPGRGYGAAAPGIGGPGYGRGAMDAGPEPGAGMHGGYRRLGDLLLGSSFRAAFGSDEDGGRWLTAWGRGAGARFQGEADGVALDGDVRTFTAGADAEWRRWLTGVAVSYSTGQGDYRDHGGRGAGSLDSTMTTVLPYLRWKAGDRLSAWGTAGFGGGDLKLVPDGADEGWKTGISMRTVAAGARGVFARTGGGLELAGRVDARLTSVESDAADGPAGNLAATSAEVSRVRFMFEGTKRFELGVGRVLTPTLEVGVRRDGGDAETGAGLEVGGALRYADAALGLTVDLNARTLAAHSDGAYREWGASAKVTLDPGAAGLGLSLSLAPEWGAAGAGGAERLWSMRDARDLARGGGADLGGRLAADVGYGLSWLGGRGTMTPFAGLASSAYGRDLRTGVRWMLGELLMSLEATRRESALSPAEHGAAFTASARW